MGIPRHCEQCARVWVSAGRVQVSLFYNTDGVCACVFRSTHCAHTRTHSHSILGLGDDLRLPLKLLGSPNAGHGQFCVHSFSKALAKPLIPLLFRTVKELTSKILKCERKSSINNEFLGVQFCLQIKRRRTFSGACVYVYRWVCMRANMCVMRGIISLQRIETKLPSHTK